MGFDNKIKQVIIRNTKHRTLPEVVKLVDAADSKSAVRDDVSVRVRPSGPSVSLHRFFKAPSLIYQRLGALLFLAFMFFYGIFRDYLVYLSTRQLTFKELIIL